MPKLSKIKLNKQYGRYWSQVLLYEPAGKGWFEVAKLPTEEEYKQALRKKFSFDVGDLLEDAKSEVESLCGELQDWYDNLPPGFQSGDKGDQLQEAISTLENISFPDLPDFLSNTEGSSQIRVFCSPTRNALPGRTGLAKPLVS